MSGLCWQVHQTDGKAFDLRLRICYNDGAYRASSIEYQANNIKLGAE